MNPISDIETYFKELVAEKQRAGMPISDAKKVAGDQIYSDVLTGRVERDKAIQWLISHEVEQGSTPEAAELQLRQRFPDFTR